LTEISDKNFGVVIAYLLPGLVALAAGAEFLPFAQGWLGASNSSATIGGFLYGTLASLALGLSISAVRWMVLDALHHRTGLAEPERDFASLKSSLSAFDGAVQNHYRYYQFYGNMFVAVVVAAVIQWPLDDFLTASPAVNAVAVLVAASLLFVASRDALRKYYARTGALLRPNFFPREVHDDQRMARS
jgi:hypothetical protein